ncbi:hypothetical protein [Bittarella sp. HCP28S3_D9]|uniref:hypothetical protein n=1 Tax=Bittarella sp. HCP28S3_D9 TaxID=3440253 RepID=UPI003F8A9018
MTLLEKEKEPPLVRLRRGLGSPWTGLGIYGVGTLIKGLFYLPMLGNPSRLPAVEQWGGPNLWAFVWIIVGAFAICAVLTRRCGAIAAGGLFFIYLIWGGMYLIAEVYGNYPLGSMASVVYLLVAATIFWAFSRPPVEQIIVKSTHCEGEGDSE